MATASDCWQRIGAVHPDDLAEARVYDLPDHPVGHGAQFAVPDGWVGASLRASSISGDASAQQTQVRAFLGSAVAASLALLQRQG